MSLRAAALGVVLAAAHLEAQQPRQIVVRVRVVDSAGTPIRGADVSILRGLQQAVGNGATDDRGARTLIVSREDGDYS